MSTGLHEALNAYVKSNCLELAEKVGEALRIDTRIVEEVDNEWDDDADIEDSIHTFIANLVYVVILYMRLPDNLVITPEIIKEYELIEKHPDDLPGEFSYAYCSKLANEFLVRFDEAFEEN